MSKAANNATELDYINYISSNNSLNFTATVIGNGAPIADVTAGVYANGAFAQANLAYAQANTAFSNTNLNVSGTLRMLNQGGSEGGELFLDKPVSNTSLVAGVTVDIFQNQLRIFETGGGIRGAFIDIANTTANGIGSEIVKYNANNISTGFLTLPIGTIEQRPASPERGSMRYNSSNNVVEVYMPSAGWVTVAQDTFTLEYIAVAGGGGGGQWAMGGGGGAGGVAYSTSLSTPIGVAYTVTVGAGGGVGNQSPNGPNASPGSNSSIVAAATGTNIVALGGGAGGGANQSAGQPGGSGGGSNGGGVGTGLVGQGNPGGLHNGSNAWGGGGGGAGAVGGAATSGAGAGGIGVNYASFAPFSASGYFGGGGGGGAHSSGASPAAAPGGTGGGGTGGIFDSTSGQAGSTNTGGGGGGASGKTGVYGASGGAGGSGIVVIRYSGTTQRATGGTITTSGGYTYHLFTGSGTFNFTG